MDSTEDYTPRKLTRGLQLPISERRTLIVFGDIVMVFAATLVSLRIWAIVGQRTFDVTFVGEQAHWFIILGMLWLTLAAANDFYNLALSADWGRSQARLAQITLQLLVVYLLIFFFSPREALPRLFIVYYAVSSYVLIALWRLIRPFLVGWQPLRRRVVIVGVGWAARTIIEAIEQHVPDDFEVVGIVDEASQLAREDIVIDADVIGSGADLARIVRELQASEVILATSGNVDGELFQSIMDCYELGIPVTPMPLLYEQLTGMVPVEYVRGHWNIVLPLEGRSSFDPYPIIKRLIDITLAIVGLLIFALMLPLLAIVLIIDSPGPVFFAQERLGLAGKPFRVFKLRTMIPDAERESGPLWAVRGDPRVTAVGRLLRKSRLDEVPQLVNVLLGQLSMVGPRPERPEFVAILQEEIPFYRARLSVLPGLTGWAQVNYRYGSSVDDALMKLQYDLYYIRHRSVLLDGLILLKTVGQVLALRGT